MKYGVVHQEATLVTEADEVWIATAFLHRENPERNDFTVREIRDRAAREAINGRLRIGVYRHAHLHCVANLPPNTGKWRMLYATGRLTRRLYREGDPYHPAREGARSLPDRENIPGRYHHLLVWYHSDYSQKHSTPTAQDSILELCGLGKGLWKDEDPDSYVRRLREE